MIEYTYPAVQFILEHYQVFQSGHWGNPGAAVDAGIPVKTHNYRAPFEAPVIYASEIGRRVKLCEEDGLIVELRYGIKGEPKEPKEIWLERRIPVATTLQAIHKVTLYCCDIEFSKGISYKTWKHINRSKISRMRQGVANSYQVLDRITIT